MNVQKLQASLPLIDSFVWVGKELVEAKVKPMSVIRDGMLIISDEDGNGFIDYYGQFSGGYPFIVKELEAWAKSHGGYLEWNNPSEVVFTK